MSVTIEGITADHKPSTVLHEDQAHNRYIMYIFFKLLIAQIFHHVKINVEYLQEIFIKIGITYILIITKDKIIIYVLIS